MTPLVVDSDAVLEMATGDLRTVKALLLDLDRLRSRITRPLREALQAVEDLFREPRAFFWSRPRAR